MICTSLHSGSPANSLCSYLLFISFSLGFSFWAYLLFLEYKASVLPAKQLFLLLSRFYFILIVHFYCIFLLLFIHPIPFSASTFCSFPPCNHHTVVHVHEFLFFLFPLLMLFSKLYTWLIPSFYSDICSNVSFSERLSLNKIETQNKIATK